MAEDLQALLARINEQGVSQAEAQKEKILSKARDEAETILSDAREESEKLKAGARREAELMEQKGRDSLKQAARDTLLSLGERLRERVERVARKCIARDGDPEAFAKAMADWVKEQLSSDAHEAVEVDVSKKDAKAMEKHVLAALGEDLKEDVTIAPVPDVEGGFELRFDDSDVVYDFSQDALLEVVTRFVNPRLAEIMRETESDDEGA